MAVGAAQTLAERGVEGTSFATVLARTNSPRGSTYHHFPGGKNELVVAALDLASQQALAYMEPVRGRPAKEVVERFVGMWRLLLESSDLRSGCAVVAVTVAGESNELLDHAGQIFRSWTDHLAAMLAEGGLTRRRAVDLATLAIAATEGAVALCRAERSLTPLDVVGRQLSRLAD
jgi:AcrR family transcriptional regulator